MREKQDKFKRLIEAYTNELVPVHYSIRKISGTFEFVEITFDTNGFETSISAFETFYNAQ
jgi:hypothetical protein